MYEDSNLKYPNEKVMSIFSYIKFSNFNFHKFVFKSNFKNYLYESHVQYLPLRAVLIITMILCFMI